MIFLVEGIITAGVGVLCYFIMTDRPSTARWLNEEEKELAIARIKTQQIGATVVLDKMNAKRLFQGFFAPSTIVIAFIALLANITVGGAAFFTPVRSKCDQERVMEADKPVRTDHYLHNLPENEHCWQAVEDCPPLHRRRLLHPLLPIPFYEVADAWWHHAVCFATHRHRIRNVSGYREVSSEVYQARAGTDPIARKTQPSSPVCCQFYRHERCFPICSV
jgi:hypothetical protein